MPTKKKTSVKPEAIGKEPKETPKPNETKTAKSRRPTNRKTPKAKATTAPARKPDLTPVERHSLIAEAAYYLYLLRGSWSDPRQNWLDAEAEVDARLKKNQA
jgi:hypothetical protein